MHIRQYGIIYMVTNVINRKIYIGQTTQSLKSRKQKHLKDSKYTNYLFHNALKKYGFENFKWEIIDYAYSKNELNELEKKWIKQYNTFIDFEQSHGYNMTDGGSVNAKHSQETLKKYIEEQGKN